MWVKPSCPLITLSATVLLTLPNCYPPPWWDDDREGKDDTEEECGERGNGEGVVQAGKRSYNADACGDDRSRDEHLSYIPTELEHDHGRHHQPRCKEGGRPPTMFRLRRPSSRSWEERVVDRSRTPGSRPLAVGPFSFGPYVPLFRYVYPEKVSSEVPGSGGYGTFPRFYRFFFG
jgi:hypothetical protein